MLVLTVLQSKSLLLHILAHNFSTCVNVSWTCVSYLHLHVFASGWSYNTFLFRRVLSDFVVAYSKVLAVADPGGI